MIKKKLHTLQYLQNKEEINDEIRRLGLLERQELLDEELLTHLRSQMEERDRNHKKYMRKMEIGFYLTLGGLGIGLIIMFYLLGLVS